MHKIRIKSFIHSLFFFPILFYGCGKTGAIKWLASTNDLRWYQESLEFSEATGTTNVIGIIESQAGQVIDGFGACFNELGWDALSVLGTDSRDSVVSLFFGPESELKFTLGRVPIGANDYAMDWYSLNDSAGDFSMKYFTISRDRERLIPYIKTALRYEPQLRIWGSPWCPPVWMKNNGHYACRMSEVNDLCCVQKEGKEGITQFIMQPEYLGAYALYFSRFVQAYRAEGIPVYAVHVQNEPNSCQNFPSCIWKPSDLAIFIGRFLGPKFDADQTGAEIWYGTIERPHIRNIDTVMEDDQAMKYIKGLGFQWAGKEVIGRANEKYPAIPLMETESECGDGSNDWKAAEYTFGLIRHYLENGANSYMYWNMVLDETGKSRWGWKQNSLITVDRASKKITFNPEFYLFKHFSYFIEPRAQRIVTRGNRKEVAAFKNPSGSVTVVIYNPMDTDDEVVVNTSMGNFKATMAPRSFNTFVYGIGNSNKF
ncbi:MAG TPA: glycoside hydrolase family 30 beta sandwich domain-containing protein [Cyclobacteriaceae bacterium]|nr:glycoside hydrolase family 30 beta sandwich domain-containing protein [Cyclobacteriaceae bacterium]